MWLSSSSSFSITSQKSLHRKEVMISRCETSLILVLSHGFNNNLSFQLSSLFIMSIYILHFGATHSFQVRTELGSLCSPSYCWAGWVAADGHMCCLSCTPSREWVIKDVLHAPAEHSSTVKCRYFSSCFCLKYLIVSFPYLHLRVCQQTDCRVFSSAVVPVATGALLHKATGTAVCASTYNV